ncbi:MAG TPA: nucleotidyl transferase AbiEii/AbiGii toxin family protein [Chitinispirillaceae bacterium]|nr:nucleotidyl transferase AbiEii/AbiGii toxin family protein [Chitinispirillaceae bacterium]
MEFENRESYFRESHIISSAFNTSKIITEQALHCLECVAQLNESGLQFIFKGGNALLLMLENPERFSTDVDISTDESTEAIEQHLNKITGFQRVFKKWEKRHYKIKSSIPAISYNLYFTSLFSPSQTNSISIDIQLKKNCYKTEIRQINCGRLFISSVNTEIPLPSSIIGEKLLALGPFTMGIPLSRSSNSLRLKHIFDISRLLQMKPSLSLIRESLHCCIGHENHQQKKNISLHAIIIDTISMLWSSVSPADSFKWGIKELYNEHKKGLQPFSSHLFQPGYSWAQLQTDMSRVALCIAGAGNSNIADAEFEKALEEPFTTGTLPFPILLNNPSARNYWNVALLWAEKFNLKKGDFSVRN